MERAFRKATVKVGIMGQNLTQLQCGRVLYLLSQITRFDGCFLWTQYRKSLKRKTGLIQKVLGEKKFNEIADVSGNFLPLFRPKSTNRFTKVNKFK